METYHIHFNGIVQGVGFRPMLYLLATEMGLTGTVSNGNDGVNITFNADSETANLFFKKIKSALPPKANVIVANLKKTIPKDFKDFSIVTNEADAEKQVLIAPDIAMCASCKTELNDKYNRRYRYPFITCTQCGPRYSIIKSLPYERSETTMDKFVMCKSCNDEYHDVLDRRFFSQTNSCAECGIKLRLYANDKAVLSEDTEGVLFQIKSFLRQGKIVAIKGIGGYLLLCDAGDYQAIQSLRSHKRRPAKPFAVLYPDVSAVNRDFALGESERGLLQSPEAPIVLLHPKNGAAKSLAIDQVAPGLNRVGVMIPCSPLLELVAQDFGGTLIATSANISGSPIIYRDEDALECLFDIASYVVTYNREITIPQDDSVVQVSTYTHQQLILRRSRGFAPSFISYRPRTGECLLSTGAFLKSSFTLSVNGNVFVSQFLGSGAGFESQQMYRYTLEHWLAMYQIVPDVIITDKHPDYFAHQYAIELAGRYNVKLKYIQHHEAHFLAVLAENELLETDIPVLGVIWDGTGMGSDGDIWGGEFFSYHHKTVVREYHFDYFPAIAGDQMALQPRISALCAAHKARLLPEHFKEKFTETEWNNYRSLLRNTNLFTSSVGRLFDAVASLLNLCDRHTYEGEAAMYLAALAEEYVNINGFVMDKPYSNEELDEDSISTTSLIGGVILDIQEGRPAGYIAARFHYSLVCLIDSVAKRSGFTQICFSGGVFQNALLVDWLVQALHHKYQLFFHKNLSPNDENISFGQMVYYDNGIVTLPKSAIPYKVLDYSL